MRIIKISTNNKLQYNLLINQMGNVQTFEQKTRRPIFKSQRSPLRYQNRSPIIGFSTSNRVYHPNKSIKPITNNNYSPYNANRYKYPRSQSRTKHNHIYKNLQQKLSKGNIRYLPSSKSFRVNQHDQYHRQGQLEYQPYIKPITNELTRSWINQPSNNLPKENINDIQHLQRDPNSYINDSCMEGCVCSPRNNDQVYNQQFRNRDEEEIIATQRKIPKWYNCQLPEVSQALYDKNRSKCQSIIKKVRNFNDFLNLIKKKVQLEKQKCLDESNLQNPYKNSQNQASLQESNQLSLMFKLQNQKIQLEKYRKMIQRQLSKQHSISSISIEDKDSSHKIIRIQYQKDGHEKPQINIRHRGQQSEIDDCQNLCLSDTKKLLENSHKGILNESSTSNMKGKSGYISNYSLCNMIPDKNHQNNSSIKLREYFKQIQPSFMNDPQKQNNNYYDTLQQS